METKLTMKAARVNKNLSQKESAKIIGVSKDTIGNWERGKSFPSAKYIPKLEKAYGIKYDNIIFLNKNNALSVSNAARHK